MDDFLTFVAVGFVAQMIDGALGMAYGVSSTTVLLSLGISPSVASASVHAAEVVTTGVSGLSHLKFGNVDRAIVPRLIVPGVVGGVVGAYLLTSIPGSTIKPFVAAYLALMGVLILWKAVRHAPRRDVRSHLVPLGLVGGFCDAVGGGGWGPIVTSTLVARGKDPRFTIGTVSATEFFVALAQSVTFLFTIGFRHGGIIAGLLVGGALAAPLAAWVCARVPTRTMMLLVGFLVVGLSIRTMVLTLH